MAGVTLSNVSKIYDNNVAAVSNLNLAINDGEFMVIVGPSGCGKTTTLRMIAGLEEISSGRITIGDTVVNDIPPKDRDIAMVFQNYALYPHMTVFDNMAFGLKLRKIPRAQIKDRVTEAAKMLNIDQLLDRKPKALSGGQRQRVALGRAIVRNPKAFLFDEPLSNLDAKLRVSTRAELKALHHRLKTTSIYVTHDQAEAMTLGDRICLMYNGCLQQVAPPIEMYEKPVNRFVAGFLGTPSMNFFDGRLEMHENKPSFITKSDRLALPACFKPLLDNCAGRQLVLGIRPEAILTRPLQELSENAIQASVHVIEQLGDGMEVYAEDAAGSRFVASLEPHTPVKPQEKIRFYLDLNKAHIFEPGETGKNLSLPLK